MINEIGVRQIPHDSRKALMDLREVIWRIAARAGKQNARNLLVYLSADRDRPPTLQWFNKKTGKATGRKADRGRRARRVVVGVRWIQHNMPTEWAALCALRIRDSKFPIEQLTKE